jgi:hypothetical protein
MTTLHKALLSPPHRVDAQKIRQSPLLLQAQLMSQLRRTPQQLLQLLQPPAALLPVLLLPLLPQAPLLALLLGLLLGLLLDLLELQLKPHPLQRLPVLLVLPALPVLQPLLLAPLDHLFRHLLLLLLLTQSQERQ